MVIECLKWSYRKRFDGHLPPGIETFPSGWNPTTPALSCQVYKNALKRNLKITEIQILQVNIILDYQCFDFVEVCIRFPGSS